MWPRDQTILESASLWVSVPPKEIPTDLSILQVLHGVGGCVDGSLSINVQRMPTASLLGSVGAIGRWMDADWSRYYPGDNNQLELVWMVVNDDQSSCHKLCTVTDTTLHIKISKLVIVFLKRTTLLTKELYCKQ